MNIIKNDKFDFFIKSLNLKFLLAILFITSFTYSRAQSSRNEALLYTSLSINKADFCYNSLLNNYSNGINAVKHAIDSLNNIYASLKTNDTYYSLEQGFAYKIITSGLNNAMVNDIKRNISFTAFKVKYPLAVAENKQLYIMRMKYNSIAILDVDYTRWYEEYNKISFTGNWAYSILDHQLFLFYMPAGLRSKPLPDKYAHIANLYVWNTDTNIRNLTRPPYEEAIFSLSNVGPKTKKFIDYISVQTHKPHVPSFFTPNFLRYTFDSCYHLYINDLLHNQRSGGYSAPRISREHLIVCRRSQPPTGITGR